MRSLVVMIVVASACTYVPELTPCSIRCDDGACPNDQTCLADGLCHASSDEPLCNETPPPPPLCSGDTCTAPPSECHVATGTCTDGTCVYPFADDAPCTNNRPAPTCTGGVSRSYSATGACNKGTCVFTPVDKQCSSGCAGTECAIPQVCSATCAKLDQCGTPIANCAIKCRDQCTSALDVLAVCASVTTCGQLALCNTSCIR